jgi:DNA-binding transcriptional MerR regulator
MNTIKTSFSIKDLENLSGIKAHTIRMWEKRYNLLEPERTNTNIRTYNLQLKKLTETNEH